MKTIKAISSSNKITELKQAFAVGDIAPNKNYVLKSAASGTIVQYSIFFFQTDSDGNLSNYVFRMPGYNPYPASTFTGTAKISAGDEFYELDRPY